MMLYAESKRAPVLSDPPLLKALFNNPVLSVVWVIVRLFVGYEWLEAGVHKLENPAWTSTGLALKGFWTAAVAIPAQGKPAITYDWYRGFLSAMLEGGHYTWFAKLVVAGELAIGIALIIGAAVGVAAFFGALMNFNFMLAGSASTNPVLLVLAVLLIIAWKTAGYWGVDRWLLPLLARLANRQGEAAEAEPQQALSRQGSRVEVTAD
ncbi:MAG: DoxX family membrane protein [Bacteroidetes bacterium]|nr:DoxX family membrane protein [Bacteroidota bacterium]MCL5025028.1 DoxX family membrane protein [Chloroflexota bacterium]